jgi:signal transduction histidine kinase
MRVGIKPEDQEKLFDRFYRIENGYTSKISGFGFGLYLSAEIIHVMTVEYGWNVKWVKAPLFILV